MLAQLATCVLSFASGPRERTALEDTDAVKTTYGADASWRSKHAPHTMNISWVSTAKLTRLVKALNEHSRAWREVMNKEGDAREAVGMLCQSDLRRRLQGERHLVKQGGSTASAHLQGGWDGLDREGIVSQRDQQGLRALQ